MNDKLYLKKLKSEYEYLKVEVQYQANLFEKAKSEFDKRFTDKLNLNVPDSKKVKEEKPVRKKSLDKVYKKLAQKIHPDKKTGDSDDFKKLKKSVDDSDTIYEYSGSNAQSDAQVKADELTAADTDGREYKKEQVH